MRFSSPSAIDMAATGRNIARLRQEAGISVREMQALFGFSSPQAIYKWQRGESLPALENMVLLARLLDRTVEDLLIFTSEGREP